MVLRRDRAAPRKKRRDEPSAEDDRSLLEVLEQFGQGGYRCKLYRLSATPPRKPNYVDTLELTAVDFVEEVKSVYGGGEYRGLVLDSAGKYQKGANLNFAIEGKPKAVDGDTSSGSSTDKLLEKLLEEKVKPRDWTETATAVAGVVAAATAAMVPLVKLFTDNRKSDSAGASVTDTLKLVQDAETKGEERGRTIGRLESGGGGSSSDSLAEVARSYAGPIIGLIQQNMSNRRQRVTVETPATAPATAPAAMTVPVAITQGPPMPEHYQWLEMLRRFYPQLEGQARMNTDPNVIADYALEQMAPPMRLAVAQCAPREDFRPTLRAELSTVAQQNPEWLEDFLSRIVEVSAEDLDKEEPAPTPTPGRAAAKRGRTNA